MPLVRVDNLEDRRLRPYSGMTDGQLKRGEGFRRDHPNGMFVGESGRVIERALDAGLRPLSVLVDRRWLDHDRAIVDRIAQGFPDAPVFEATPQQFRDLTGYEVVRGALACFERPAAMAVEDVLSGARRVAILEDVTNYANMGAIFRSAAALGMDAVLVSPSCHDPYYRRCARVSMGAVFQVPWARIEAPAASAGPAAASGAAGPKRADASPDRGKAASGRASGSPDWAVGLVPRLRERGFTTVALALREDALDLRDPRLAAAERLTIVLGTEGDGLLDSTIAACDHTVCIPMAHGVDSLNVAACAAIAFWELSGR